MSRFQVNGTYPDIFAYHFLTQYIDFSPLNLDIGGKSHADLNHPTKVIRKRDTYIFKVDKGLSSVNNRIRKNLLIKRMNFMGARVLLEKKGITLLATLWLFAIFSGEFGCRRQVILSNFEYLEGTLVHAEGKILVVKADDGQKTVFRVGRKTVFTPKAWPKFGDRLKVKYHTRVYWHKATGNYYIGYEVKKVEYAADVRPKTAVLLPEIQKKKAIIPESQREHPKPSLKAPSRQAVPHHWAVIVGVSDYHDSRIPSLRYAAADAQSFYNWLASPDGGRYPRSRIKLLVNEQATGSNIKEALFVWLKQAIEEDMVIIFFAGHGSPDSPDSPENLFLLPYDAQYDSIATTGFPMWDIETALKRFIKARKVVVVADACHAGGVGQGFDVARRANRAIKRNPISSGLQNLSMIGAGVAVISASDDRQFSQEGEKWGGGHGVFTHFLLKGLKGEADYNKDKRVTLGELIPFLSEQVRRATMNAQSPMVAGKFDPALSIGR